MVYFIESFGEVKKYEICLFAIWKVVNKVISKFNELCLKWSSFSESMLNINKEYVVGGILFYFREGTTKIRNGDIFFRKTGTTPFLNSMYYI
jgi:hypothetical protein